MDYLNVGSNGFAQVGNEHYFAKSKIEMGYLLELIENKFPIPPGLKMLCRFAVKAFPHDFGTYHEIVLHFDDDAIGDGYDDEDDENDDAAEALHNMFWDWFHQVEAFDIESGEITQAIQAKYLASLNTEKGEHLSIVPKRIAS
jgi:hypothetical protein